MNRRGFLGSILAASVAPAFVRADSLMRIAAPLSIALPPAPDQWQHTASGILVSIGALPLGATISIEGVKGTFRVTSS